MNMRETFPELFCLNRKRYKPRSSEGYVYLIQAKNSNRFKIGMSENPEARLMQIQTMSPLELELIGYYWSDSMYQEEQKWHTRLQEFRVQGEWFQLSEVKGFLTSVEFFLKMFEQILRDEDIPYNERRQLYWDTRPDIDRFISAVNMTNRP